MAWTTTSLKDRRERIWQDFLSYSGTGDAVLLKRSVEYAIAWALAGACHALESGYIRWASRQIIPSEDSDIDSILRWANNHLDVPRVAASAAKGDVVFTGTAAATIPLGSKFASRQGQVYEADAEYVIGGGGSVTGAVTCTEAGADGNAEGGLSVFAVSPITNIDDEATVDTGGIGGGADDEGKLSILQRLRQRLKSPPRGGSPGDYVVWALEVAGVSRAFEFQRRVGHVDIVIVDDTNDLEPSAQLITDVQTYVDARKPLAIGGCLVQGPVRDSLSLFWSDLVPATSTAQQSIEDAVEAYILEVGEPGKTLNENEIENVAQSAPGIIDVTLDSTSGTTPGSGDPNTQWRAMFWRALHTWN